MGGGLTRHQGDKARVDFASFNGRVRVVNFWATWCAPCQKEIPELLKTAKEFEPQGVELLAVDQDSGEDARDYVDEFLLSHPSDLGRYVFYGDDKFMSQFRVEALPTTYVLDKRGAVVERFVGPLTADVLTRAINRALKPG
jgi:thiol-disulfide isomerase/thioredoxin